MKIGEKTIAKETGRMKATGKIDGLIGADNVGFIIDHFNEMVDKKREKEYHKEISDRNQYFWKLWKRAAEEVRTGVRTVKRLKPRNTWI